ncbi:MAG TPA: hypothetical protein VK141_08960 [Nitrosomonas sp.]|nr:hypothetical protein [Nitrosomonas sp.]
MSTLREEYVWQRLDPDVFMLKVQQEYEESNAEVLDMMSRAFDKCREWEWEYAHLENQLYDLKKKYDQQ